jgi:hypothetical protein
MKKPKKELPKEKPNAIDRSVFRPSALPKLEECIHYKGDTDEDVETEFMARGQRLHSLCASVLAGEMETVQIEDPEDRACVEWSIEEIRSRGVLIEFVEYEVPITIKGEEVTGGTVDCWGMGPIQVKTHQSELWLFDFKSGDERDYSAQFVAYSKPIMEEKGKQSAVFCVLYYDLREAREFDVELAECEPRLERLAIRWLTRESEEPRINRYCGWCTVKGSCKLWLAEAKHALVLLPEATPELLENVDRITEIKSNPEALGAFYSACKRLVKLMEEWQLKEAVQQYLESGTGVPGFTMSHRSGEPRINIEMALIEVLPQIGAMRFAPCIGVNVRALKEAWEGFITDKPFPLEITEGPTAYFPKSTVPHGTGKARMARNKRLKEAK